MNYICPMKCEGDKTYPEPGDCSVCGMHLKELKDISYKHSKKHNHNHKNNKKIRCICGEKDCTGSCVTNYQCTYQEINLQETVSTDITPDKNGQYSCPMKCEEDKTYSEPGDCPVCGMHLEKVIAFGSPQSEEDNEDIKAYKKMLFRFIIAVIFTLPIFILSMGELIPGLKEIIANLFSKRINLFIQLALTIPVVFFASSFVFKKGFLSIIKYNLNMFTLISIGAGVAWIYSIVALLFPQIFPESFHNQHGLINVYFEASTVILTLVIMGQVLELRAHAKTNNAIKELLNLVPSTVVVIRDGNEHEISLQNVIVSDKIRIKPGAKIPVDGTIIEGNGVVDESMITGEPIPVEKNIDDKITGGTINNNGSFIFKAEKVGKDTLLARIIEMVNEASRSKAPIQKMADVIAKYFVQIVVAIAILTFLIWGFGFSKWSEGFLYAIAVLIIACPCALGLATPVSIMVGTGKGAKYGILIKNAKAIEQMRKVDTVLVDKTGTLTLGKPTLQNYKKFKNYTNEQILQFAASVDSNSEHPLANAIVQAAKGKNIKLLEIKDFKSITGMGVTAKIDGKEVSIGNDKLIDHYKASHDYDKKLITELQEKGQTVMYVLIDKKVEGIVTVADPIKESTPLAVDELHENNVKVIMLTGDNEITAKSVANELGLDDFKAECLPEEKFAKVKSLQSSNAFVAMAGDGINDAPALAQADVGIAMGTGTDVAMESADITLVKGDLIGIARAKLLSIIVMKNIKQNLFFAFIYNGIGIPIAALGLLNPMFAGLAMAFSSVSVLTNALRIQNKKI